MAVSGLGLAISRRLAEMMGGRIGVDSAPTKVRLSGWRCRWRWCRAASARHRRVPRQCRKGSAGRMRSPSAVLERHRKTLQRIAQLLCRRRRTGHSALARIGCASAGRFRWACRAVRICTGRLRLRCCPYAAATDPGLASIRSLNTHDTAGVFASHTGNRNVQLENLARLTAAIWFVLVVVWTAMIAWKVPSIARPPSARHRISPAASMDDDGRPDRDDDHRHRGPARVFLDQIKQLSIIKDLHVAAPRRRRGPSARIRSPPASSMPSSSR